MLGRLVLIEAKIGRCGCRKEKGREKEEKEEEEEEEDIEEEEEKEERSGSLKWPLMSHVMASDGKRWQATSQAHSHHPWETRSCPE